MSTHRQLKLVLIFGFFLYISGILFLWSHPEHGWALFIFQQTKTGLSVLYIAAVVGILVFVFLQIKILSETKKLLTVGTILLLVMINLAVIYLWKISGYYFVYGMDIYNYMGQVKDFISLGHIPHGGYYPSFYPAHTLLHSVIVLVSNITIYSSFVGFTAFIYILLVLLSFITILRLFKQYSIPPVALRLFMLMSIPNFLGMFVYPYNQSYSVIIFFEFIFFIIYALQKTTLSVLTSIILLLMVLPLAHPIVSFITIPFLMGLVISSPKKRMFYVIYLTYFVIYSAWYFYISTMGLWGYNIKLFFSLLFRETSMDIAMNWTQKSIHVIGSTWDFVGFVMYNLFPILFLGILAVISIKYLLGTNQKILDITKMTVKLVFVATLLSVFTYIAFAAVSFLHNPLRLALDDPLIILILILAAVTVMHQTHVNTLPLNINISRSLLLSIALSFVVFVSILNPFFEWHVGLYPSQTKTWQEPLSVKFYEEYGLPTYSLYGIGSLTQINAYISKDLGLTNSRPVTFIASNDTTKIKKNSYLFILRKEYLTYVKLYKGFRYSDSFFEKMSVTFDRIYSTNEVRIYGKF